MKNTKNLLVTGLALAITLCSSIQVFAQLTGPQRMLVKEEMDNQKLLYEDLVELRNIAIRNGNKAKENYNHNKAMAHYTKKQKLEELYGTTKTYSDSEVSNKIERIKSEQ